LDIKAHFTIFSVNVSWEWWVNGKKGHSVSGYLVRHNLILLHIIGSRRSLSQGHVMLIRLHLDILCWGAIIEQFFVVEMCTTTSDQGRIRI
jgi:hypothetical protein